MAAMDGKRENGRAAVSMRKKWINQEGREAAENILRRPWSRPRTTTPARHRLLLSWRLPRSRGGITLEFDLHRRFLYSVVGGGRRIWSPARPSSTSTGASSVPW